MAKIKLFSGMDFAGKSTIIHELDLCLRGTYACQEKFLTPIQTLKYMIENNIWISREKFIPMLEKMVRMDIKNYQESEYILQDTLWVIKFTAKLMADDKEIYAKEISELLSLIRQYPETNSFYITASMEERKRRFLLRANKGERLSRTDKLLVSSPSLFENIEKYYLDIIMELFPNTQIIDTTYRKPDEIANVLKSNRKFIN